MQSDAELNKFREELEAGEQRRETSCHVIAELIEICSVCDTIRDKARLVCCPWCPDSYHCKDGICAELHQSALHAAVAYWTW